MGAGGVENSRVIIGKESEPCEAAQSIRAGKSSRDIEARIMKMKMTKEIVKEERERRMTQMSMVTMGPYFLFVYWIYKG